MIDLRDRVAVVTGATAGLGRVCCHHLAREGMRLALVARTTAALDALAAELRETASAVQLCPIPADVTQSAGVAAMAERVQSELGAPYLLVNAMNIGRLPGGPFQSSSLEEFELALNTKPRGYYLTMRALLPGMLERREGCVTNVASGAGVSGSPGGARLGPRGDRPRALGGRLSRSERFRRRGPDAPAPGSSAGTPALGPGPRAVPSGGPGSP